MRVLSVLILVAIGVLLLTGRAEASTVLVSGGQLQILGNAFETNDLLVTQIGSSGYRVIERDRNTLVAGAGCTPLSTTTANCSGPITSYSAILGDGSDSFRWLAPALTGSVSGDDGDDFIFGGSGAETLSGGAGDDLIEGNLGADIISGDAGSRDRVTYEYSTAGVSVTLDGVANDGVPFFDQDNVLSVEEITGSAYNDVLVGDGVDNKIVGGRGQDNISALGGNDQISVRDGEIDQVSCGAGDDNASYKDANDAINADCYDIALISPVYSSSFIVTQTTPSTLTCTVGVECVFTLAGTGAPGGGQAIQPSQTLEYDPVAVYLGGGPTTAETGDSAWELAGSYTCSRPGAGQLVPYFSQYGTAETFASPVIVTCN